MADNKKGIFITMEGSDGSGKTTQINLLSEFLKKNNYDVIITREPGGTNISEAVREILLNPEFKEMDPTTELLLYTAARAQLMAQVIRPALEAGKAVISDRFIDSALVYQGIARGLGVDNVYNVNQYAVQGCMPDMTFLLDLTAEEGIKRKKNQKELDRMEQEKLSFHRQVSDGYRSLADKYPERITKIDATLPIADIYAIIEAQVQALI